MSVFKDRVVALLEPLEVDGFVKKVKLQAHRTPWATAGNIVGFVGLLVGMYLGAKLF